MTPEWPFWFSQVRILRFFEQPPFLAPNTAWKTTVFLLRNKSITYSYLGFLPKLRQHVVEVAYWENTDWLIIEENGNMVRLVSPPNYSPNRQNILAGSCGIEYEMAPNRVQVFKTKNNKLALAWEITPELWEPTEAFWGNDSTVFVKQKWFKYNGTSVDRYRVGYKPSRFTYSRIVVK